MGREMAAGLICLGYLAAIFIVICDEQLIWDGGEMVGRINYCHNDSLGVVACGIKR